MTQIIISENAAKEIQKLIEQKPENKFFRIIVEGGGCSGFKYEFKLDQEKHNSDIIFEKNNIKVAIDEISLSLMDGTELDYVETMTSSEFELKNPNATSSCGCGQSFSI